MPISAAPMPTPVIASSASGTSKLRSDPNSLWRPSVVPNMPRASSTPCPITNTLGSRAISDRVASNTASPYVSVRLSARKDMVVDFLILGEGAGFGECDGVGHPLLFRRLDRLALIRRQQVADDLEVVALDLGVELLVRPVLVHAVLAGTDMVAPAIGHAFEEARTVAAAHGGDRGAGALVQLHRLMVLDQLGRNAVGVAARLQAGAGEAILHVAVDGVEVVLADEQDRQLPERGEVHALVPGALVGRALAEEADHDRLGLPHLERQRRTDRVGDAGRHHRRRAHHVHRRIDQVHRARLAAGTAVHLAVQLGHHALHIPALGEVERMAAIGAEQHIALLEMIADGRRDRFLADAEMHRTLDLVRGIEADDLLLDPADQIHRTVEAGRGAVCTLFHQAATSTLCLQYQRYMASSPSASGVRAFQPSAARRPLSSSRRGAPSGLLVSKTSSPL